MACLQGFALLQAFFDVRLMSERSKNIKNQRLRSKILNRFFVAYTLKMSTSVNIYIFEFQLFSTSTFFEFQVL